MPIIVGTRYLLTENIGDNINHDGADAWKSTINADLVAHANDIIEFTGQHWAVVFDAQNETTSQYVTNLTTGIQYRWDGSSWSKSYEGYYDSGKWQLII